MTFCKFYQDCANADKCDRPLTPEVIEAAQAWWGSEGAPIAVFTNKPLCHSTRTELNE